MSPISAISLSSFGQTEQGKITQLYRYLELFSEGTPARNSVFVFAPAPGPLLTGGAPTDDQLLIIDPPADLNQRFKLGSQVAALYTGTPQPTSVPLMQTVAGGVAHLRIGEHFLDVYSQQQGAVVHLPALGIICGGTFGSDSIVPQLAPNSDGSDELETLRLLARLIKHKMALYIPHIGGETADKMVIMERLATDVAYIHALRRVVTPLALRGENVEAIADLSESVLPRDRRTPQSTAIHESNVTALIQATRH